VDESYWVAGPSSFTSFHDSLINQFYCNHEQFFFSQSPLSYASDCAYFLSWAVWFHSETTKFVSIQKTCNAFFKFKTDVETLEGLQYSRELLSKMYCDLDYLCIIFVIVWIRCMILDTISSFIQNRKKHWSEFEKKIF